MSEDSPHRHLQRANDYAKSKRISLARQVLFGFGMDGSIWRTSRHSVVKVFERPKSFHDELECYRRLQSAGVDSIHGFAIPELIDFDDGLTVLEIKIVAPPFLLDFGKVYLDREPPYWREEEIMADWHAEGRENFGNRWGMVMSLVGALQKYSIYYVDPKPGNILFSDKDERS